MINEKELPLGWKITTLGEVAKIKYGKDHKNLNDGVIPCYGSGGLMRKVDDILYDKESVLIPRKGTISNLFYVDKPFWTVDTLFYTIIDSRKIVPKYLFNYLETLKLENYNVGSAVPSLTTEVLNQIKLIIPTDINEQKSIVSILNSFDKKIELLQNQNVILDELSQTIFKEWFGQHYLKNKLPNGWRYGKLGEMIDLIIDNRGKTPPTTQEINNNFPLVEVNSITGADRTIKLNLVKKYVDEKTYNEWFRKGHPQIGDVILSTVGSIGQIGLVDDNKICIAQNIIALRNNLSGYFLYEFIKFYQHEIITLDISSVQPSIKVPHMLNLDVIIPDKHFILKFDDISKSISKKMFSNIKQIQSLTITRSELLNILIKGKIRIKM